MPNRCSPFRTLLSALVLLGLLATGCGVEPGYETLDVRYDGVPINLDAAADASASESTGEAGDLEIGPADGDGDPVVASTKDATENPDGLAYVDEAGDEAASPAVATSVDLSAHRDPEPDPRSEAVVETDAADLESVDSDARRQSKARTRALQSFRGLVANATKLSSRKVNCLVAEVDNSGVNPVPMNRALRRALSGSEKAPPPRYVALAQSAASACGVTLGESLLR